jgi:hypothetical protein
MLEQHGMAQAGEPTEWATDGTEVVDSGPFAVELLRWTKGAGRSAAGQAEINRRVETYSPIYTRVFGEAYEVRPSPLYLALETLPLDGASDDSLRAYVALREQVVEDLKEAAWKELDSAMSSD